MIWHEINHKRYKCQKKKINKPNQIFVLKDSIVNEKTH